MQIFALLKSFLYLKSGFELWNADLCLGEIVPVPKD